MNLRIIMTNQAAPNTRNNHIYLPSVCNAPDPMRHLGQFPMQREGVRWHCAARREIAERSEEAPAAEAAQPSRNDGVWKAPKGKSVGVEIGDKPSGVVRGECRGGLGGAAAPNRPPSAARRAGGPN